jgi:aldehyde dehydrogenase (NAD+)
MSASETIGHFIGGERRRGSGRIESLNPSDTNDLVATTPAGEAADVDAAVAAARGAFPAWSQASPEVRSDCLDRIGSALIARGAELGTLLAREEGKTVPEGTGEVIRAGRIFKYFAGEALRRHGQTLDSTRPGLDASTYREAVGVFGLITPWNFPIAIPAWKAAPALAFGNTVVLKPAEITPAMASVLVDLAVQAGVPEGVFNVVFGAGAAGGALAGHPGIDGISFTGSQATGAKVAMAAVQGGKRVQLEMGGKNPLVILDDADLDRAVAIALDGSFFATGQRCTASSRLIVTEGIHDRFVARLGEAVAALRVGNALDPTTQMGPVASDMQLEKVTRYIDGARGDGARFSGEGVIDSQAPGYFVRPTLLTETTPEMVINREEVFGPVASVMRVKDYQEALALANAGDFGLSAGIVTTSLKHSRDFRRNVRAGMVMINLPTAGVDYHVPFGGTRSSSYGPREQGFAAVEYYTQIKTVYVAG